MAFLALVIAVFVLASDSSRDGDHDLADARLLYQSGEYSRLEEALRARIERNPGDLDARRLLAWTLEAQARYDEACDHYRELVGADPADHESLFRWALIERARGRVDDATAHLETAYAVEPDERYADELARTYMQVGRYSEAAAKWEHLIDTAELDDLSRARVYAALAGARTADRDFEGARAAMREAVALQPDDERLRERLEQMGVDE